jgi:hypothetical protein
MKREMLRRFLFVSAACLLSIPWLTPCAGILSAALVDGAHNAVTHRDSPKATLPTRQLKQWAARRGPAFKVSRNQVIPESLLVRDEELSAANGGREASYPGTLLGKGASALVDGVTETLIWVDPVTLMFRNSLEMKSTKPERQLVICESPFVVLRGQDIRYTRDGKTGPVRLAKAKNATVMIITPEGSFSGNAESIHFRGPSQEIVLENAYGLRRGSVSIKSLLRKPGLMMRMDFVKRTVACNADIGDSWFGL